MATPTAPPAPPAEADPAPAAAPTPAGPLASLLTPIQPARSHTITPALGTTATLKQDATDTTSTSGSDNGNTTADTSNQGPVTAVLHALAARLRRTGTTRNIKQTHSISENRVSGNSTNATHATKADRTHRSDSGSQHRSNRDAKVHDLNNKVNQHHGRSGQDVKKTATSDARTADTRSAKTDSAARSSKDSRDGRDVKASTAKADRSSATTGKASKGSGSDKPDAATGGQAKPDKSKSPKPDGPAQDGAAKDSKATPDAAKESVDRTAKAGGGKPNDGQPSAAAPKDGDPKPDSPDKQQAKAPVTPDPALAVGSTERPRTQSSREAGYRDGHRAAAAVGHVKAWRDGTRDGYGDRAAADEAERKQMDEAKIRNAIRPQAPADQPTLAPASGSTADLANTAAKQALADKAEVGMGPAPGPEPIVVPPRPAAPPVISAQAQQPIAAVPVQVTEVGANAITFAADGTSHTMSRLEVRTLKGFQRRLAAKEQALGRIAEGSKDTRARAVDHAKRAQDLAEQAKGVKGGATLVAMCLRLAERAQTLRAKTEEIEKNAHRGTEAVKVLAANSETRHGGIYKAVVDSPLTSPAEREFYQDKQGS